MKNKKSNIKKIVPLAIVVIGAILVWNNLIKNDFEESSCEKDYEMRVEQMKKEYLEKNRLMDRTIPEDWEERKLYESVVPQEDSCQLIEKNEKVDFCTNSMGFGWSIDS